MPNASTLPLTEIHILEECSVIEEKCAHIYRHFAKVFSESTEMCTLWHKVASEEDHHAGIFRTAMRNLKSGMPDITPCFKDINKVIDTLELIHKEVATAPPSLAEAFELSLTMEKSLAEFHINSVIKYSSSEISELFLKMQKCDQGHLKLLQDAIDSLR